MSIATNIKKLRQRFDLTQDELGEIAGVSGGAVSTWERGTAEPRMGAVQKISDHLKVSKSEIVDDTDNQPLQQPEIDKVMLREFNKLNDFGKHAAVNYIKEMQKLTLYVAAEKEMVMAAHNDVETPEENKLMQEDMSEIDIK